MRRFALVVLVLSVVFAVAALCVPAHGTYQRHMYDWVTNRYGQAVTGASVYVYGANTTTVATIYSNLAGTTAAANPLTTDANGFWECYIDPATRVDVRIVHTALGIDETIANWAATGAGADTTDISATSGDLTVGDDLTVTRKLTVSGLAVADSIRATNIMFGAVTDSTAVGRLFAPLNHSLWLKKAGAASPYYIMAFGGTNNAPSIQLHQNTKWAWVFSDADDHACVGVDTSGTATAEDRFEIYNYRNSDAAWGYAKKSPDAAIYLYSDIPDTGSTDASGAAKEIVKIRKTDGAVNPYTSYLSLYDNATEEYSFQHQGLVLNRCAGDSSLFIQWGGGSQYTKLGDVKGGYTYLRVNNGTFYVRDDDNSDDAKLDVSTAMFDRMVIVPLRGILPTAAVAATYGNGLAYFRHFDAEPAKAGTLFIWDDADTSYIYWTSDGKKAAP